MADTVARIAPPTADRRDKMALLALFRRAPLPISFAKHDLGPGTATIAPSAVSGATLTLVAAHLTGQGEKWRRIDKAFLIAKPMRKIDKAFLIAKPMRKAYWTRRFVAGWGSAGAPMAIVRRGLTVRSASAREIDRKFTSGARSGIVTAFFEA